MSKMQFHKQVHLKEGKQKKPNCQKAKKRHKRCLSVTHKEFKRKLERKSFSENGSGNDVKK